MIVHIFLDFGTFYLSIHPCNNFVFVASRSTSRAFGVSVSADTCGWRMARLCCGRPGLLFAGYFLGGIFRNLACLESFFSLLLLLLLLLLLFFFFEQFDILRFLFSNARSNALDDLLTRK